MSWIKVERKIMEWRWWNTPNVVCLWLHLLVMANWRTKEWADVTIPRGSLVTSIGHLADECGLTLKAVRVALSKLEHTGEITKKGTNKYTIISICKYDQYQCIDYDAGQTNGEEKTRQGRIDGQPKSDKRQQPKNQRNEVINKRYQEVESDVEGMQAPACPVQASDQYMRFIKWCGENAPETLKMQHPMTEHQFMALQQEFGSQSLATVLAEMSNWRPLLSKNTSTYFTALKWLRSDRRKCNNEHASKIRGAVEQAGRMQARYDEVNYSNNSINQINYGGINYEGIKKLL